MNPDSAIETARAWISTGFLGGLLFIVAKLGKPVTEYLIETHKLRAQTKKDDRQGFGELIETLSKEVKELRVENSALRSEIRSLHDLIDGMQRGDLQARRSAQVVELRATGAQVPPATAAALDRMRDEG